MDENATKALYIAVTIFIVMITIGFVVAYFNSARKAGNLAILGSAVAENYEKLLNSDLDKTEMTGVEVVNMLRKYGGKYLFCFEDNTRIEAGIANVPYVYVMTNEELIGGLDRKNEWHTDKSTIESDYNDIIVYVDGNDNVPSKFLETINPNIVYEVRKIERSNLTRAEELSTILCGVDIRFDISANISTDETFISSETEVYVSKEEIVEEVTHTNSMKKYFKATLTLDEELPRFDLSGTWTIKLLCDATGDNISFSSLTSGDTIHEGLLLEDGSNNKIEFDYVKFGATGENGKMVIELHGLKSNNVGSNDIYINRITLAKDSIRSRDGKYSEEMKLEFSPMLHLDAPF